MQQTASLLTAVLIVWLVVSDIRRRPDVSVATWGVVVWITMVGSRPVSTWFDVSLGSGGVTQAYDEGNPLERLAYFALLLQGLLVLMARGVRVGNVIRSNAWLSVFFLYWTLSVFWSDAPLVASKRLVKDMGNVIMVLVVLTERDPVSAVKAVFARSGCLLLPLSILFIRFIPELGRTYHVWTGEMMYTGVTTHKNSLGALALVCGLFVLWDFLERPRTPGDPHRRGSLLGDLTLLGMSGWLLVRSGSATALGCGVMGTCILLAVRSHAARRHIVAIEITGLLIGLFLWLADAGYALVRYVVVDLLGRDLTLTTRTDIWPMLMAKADSEIFGSGFNSFWTGERLSAIYSRLGIIQAHNGYLETYLNGGAIALALLGMLLLSTLHAQNHRLSRDSRLAAMGLAVVSVAIVHNFTEASFDKVSLLWFAFLMFATRYRGVRYLSKAANNWPAPSTHMGRAHGAPAPSFNAPDKSASSPDRNRPWQGSHQ